MTDEAGRRVESAKARIEAASLVAEHEFCADAISRAYYGVHEAARALLLLKARRPKTHSGVENQLGLHFREKIDVAVLTRLRQDREGCDYELSSPPTPHVWRRIADAGEFVERTAEMMDIDVGDWELPS